MAEVNYTSPTERVESWLDQTTLHIRFNNVARHNALSVDMWEAVPSLLALAEKGIAELVGLQKTSRLSHIHAGTAGV